MKIRAKTFVTINILFYVLYLFACIFANIELTKYVQIGIFVFSVITLSGLFLNSCRKNVGILKNFILLATAIIWLVFFLYSLCIGRHNYYIYFLLAFLNVSIVIIYLTSKSLLLTMKNLSMVSFYFDTIIVIILAVFIPLRVFADNDIFTKISEYTVLNIVIVFAVLVGFAVTNLYWKSAKLKVISRSAQAAMLAGAFNLYYLVFCIHSIVKLGETVFPIPSLPLITFFVVINHTSIIQMHDPIEIRYSQLPENYGIVWRNTSILFPVVIMILMGIAKIFLIAPVMLIFTVYIVGIKYSNEAIRRDVMLEFERAASENMENLISIRTRELTQANEELYQLSITDSTTGLYNRSHFLNEIENFIADEIGFVLYYVEMNHFAVINDTHGHEIGDALITIAANRLKDDLGSDFFIARIGDNDFGILMRSTGVGIDASKEVRYSQIIVDSLTKEIVYKDFSVELSVSLGAVSYPSDAITTKQLIKAAYLALTEANKSKSGRKIVFYNTRYEMKIERESIIEYQLGYANFDKEFRLVYQPQYNIAEDEVTGFEALLRWDSKILGEVSPKEFIPIAERSGAIIKLGKWVIDKAFSQAKEWNENKLEPFKICINLSTFQFDSFDLIPFIKMQVITKSVSPKWFEFEVTENISIARNPSMSKMLKELKKLGFTIAIDDFGTGHSSMSYIKEYSMNRIKIAQELVENIASNKDDKIIIDAIIMICKGLNIEIIAEGCETQKQAELLIESGCESIQGFYFSVPIEAKEIKRKYLIS